MKKMWKKLMTVGLMFALLLLPAGCAEKRPDESSDNEVKEEPLYPVSFNGTEILIGETKMQTLLDDGFNVTWSEMSDDMQIEEYVVDPDTELDENSYYTGGTIWFSDKLFAHISLVTDEQKVKLGDAVIGYMEFYFSYVDDEGVLSQLAFNGVPVTELTREKAGEMFPDFKGDEAMWFSSGLNDYKYSLYFDMNTGEMTSFIVERQYDVDWNS